MAICCVSLILPRVKARGRLVAAYCQVRLTPQDFGSSRRRDFAKLNLHLALFEQPGEDDFFSSLLDLKERNVYGRDEISTDCEYPNCFLLTTKR